MALISISLARKQKTCINLQESSAFLRVLPRPFIWMIPPPTSRPSSGASPAPPIEWISKKAHHIKSPFLKKLKSRRLLIGIYDRVERHVEFVHRDMPSRARRTPQLTKYELLDIHVQYPHIQIPIPNKSAGKANDAVGPLLTNGFACLPERILRRGWSCEFIFRISMGPRRVV